MLLKIAISLLFSLPSHYLITKSKSCWGRRRRCLWFGVYGRCGWKRINHMFAKFTFKRVDLFMNLFKLFGSSRSAKEITLLGPSRNKFRERYASRAIGHTFFMHLIKILFQQTNHNFRRVSGCGESEVETIIFKILVFKKKRNFFRHQFIMPGFGASLFHMLGKLWKKKNFIVSDRMESACFLNWRINRFRIWINLHQVFPTEFVPEHEIWFRETIFYPHFTFVYKIPCRNNA